MVSKQSPTTELNESSLQRGSLFLDSDSDPNREVMIWQDNIGQVFYPPLLHYPEYKRRLGPKIHTPFVPSLADYTLGTEFRGTCYKDWEFENPLFAIEISRQLGSNSNMVVNFESLSEEVEEESISFSLDRGFDGISINFVTPESGTDMSPEMTLNRSLSVLQEALRISMSYGTRYTNISQLKNIHIGLTRAAELHSEYWVDRQRELGSNMSDKEVEEYNIAIRNQQCKFKLQKIVKP